MGIERGLVSVKMVQENMNFLDELRRKVWPYEISRSSLVNMCVGIVKHLYERGDIGVEPKQLQALLAMEPGEILADLGRSRPLPSRQDTLAVNALVAKAKPTKK